MLQIVKIRIDPRSAYVAIHYQVGRGVEESVGIASLAPTDAAEMINKAGSTGVNVRIFVRIVVGVEMLRDFSQFRRNANTNLAWSDDRYERSAGRREPA